MTISRGRRTASSNASAASAVLNERDRFLSSSRHRTTHRFRAASKCTLTGDHRSWEQMGNRAVPHLPRGVAAESSLPHRHEPKNDKSLTIAGLSFMRRRGLEPPPGYPGPGPQPGEPGVMPVQIPVDHPAAWTIWTYWPIWMLPRMLPREHELLDAFATAWKRHRIRRIFETGLPSTEGATRPSPPRVSQAVVRRRIGTMCASDCRSRPSTSASRISTVPVGSRSPARVAHRPDDGPQRLTRGARELTATGQ
jgi:hypothetical protein